MTPNPAYKGSKGVDPFNHQATLRDDQAQAYKRAYWPLLFMGDASFEVIDKLNASVQEFHLAGAEEESQALARLCADAARKAGNEEAALMFEASIQKVLDQLATDEAERLARDLTEKQEKQVVLADEIASLTERIATAEANAEANALRFSPR